MQTGQAEGQGQVDGPRPLPSSLGTSLGFFGSIILALCLAGSLWIVWDLVSFFRHEVLPGKYAAWRLLTPVWDASPQLHGWRRREETLAGRMDRLAPAVFTLGPTRPAREVDPVAPAATDPAVPSLAIVIDDWGYPWVAADDFLHLPVPLTVAVIPHLPYSREQAERARSLGHEVILHLPMEPLGDGVPVEPDTILVGMSPVEIVRTLDRGLGSVPGATGVNNHMGSRATAEAGVMHPLLADIKRRGLFFLDSHTTPRSVALETAAAHGLPLAVNRVFLDGNPDVEAVTVQLRKAMGLALQEGKAVAIGHVKPGTYEALAQLLPEIEAMGIELVPVSRLVEEPRAPRRTRALARRLARADVSRPSDSVGLTGMDAHEPLGFTGVGTPERLTEEAHEQGDGKGDIVVESLHGVMDGPRRETGDES